VRARASGAFKRPRDDQSRRLCYRLRRRQDRDSAFHDSASIRGSGYRTWRSCAKRCRPILSSKGFWRGEPLSKRGAGSNRYPRMTLGRHPGRRPPPACGTHRCLGSGDEPGTWRVVHRQDSTCARLHDPPRGLLVVESNGGIRLWGRGDALGPTGRTDAGARRRDRAPRNSGSARDVSARSVPGRTHGSRSHALR
jgi:hypothetical protein